MNINEIFNKIASGESDTSIRKPPVTINICGNLAKSLVKKEVYLLMNDTEAKHKILVGAFIISKGNDAVMPDIRVGVYQQPENHRFSLHKGFKVTKDNALYKSIPIEKSDFSKEKYYDVIKDFIEYITSIYESEFTKDNVPSHWCNHKKVIYRGYSSLWVRCCYKCGKPIPISHLDF